MPKRAMPTIKSSSPAGRFAFPRDRDAWIAAALVLVSRPLLLAFAHWRPGVPQLAAAQNTR